MTDCHFSDDGQHAYASGLCGRCGETRPSVPPAAPHHPRSIELVREFHEAFGVECADAPTPSTNAVRVLRVMLIAEELVELCDALAITLRIDTGRQANRFKAFSYGGSDSEPTDIDMAEVADALADLDYVIQGSNLAFGIPAAEVTAEVHMANMSKLGSDGKPVLLPSGKITKGPMYTPPDVARVLGVKR